MAAPDESFSVAVSLLDADTAITVLKPVATFKNPLPVHVGLRRGAVERVAAGRGAMR